VIAGGVAAAALDITYACVMAATRGVTPERVFQSIASGLLGAGAYGGGIATAVLGLVLHVFILVVAAFLYSAAARRLNWMRRHFVVCGALFGAAVFLFMNLVVLPLSNVPFKVTLTFAAVARGVVSHAFLVGLPIAWCYRYFAEMSNVSYSGNCA